MHSEGKVQEKGETGQAAGESNDSTPSPPASTVSQDSNNVFYVGLPLKGVQKIQPM